MAINWRQALELLEKSESKEGLKEVLGILFDELNALESRIDYLTENLSQIRDH